jgi:hypothetical protein
VTVTERMVPTACQLTGHVHASTGQLNVPRLSPGTSTRSLTPPTGQFITWPRTHREEPT